MHCKGSSCGVIFLRNINQGSRSSCNISAIKRKQVWHRQVWHRQAIATERGVAINGSMKGYSQELLKEYASSMAVELPQMVRIRDDFVQQMHDGLATENGSSLPMIPTLVDILPEGHEHGKFFSIDLGGTNLRVMYVKLPRVHGKVDVVEYEENPIPEHLRHAHQTELFDYLVDTLMAFAEKVGWNRPGRRKMVVGFCFSFPIAQTALDHGTLIKWVKGFDCEGAVGHDVMQLLQDAFDRKGVVADLNALVNDTVGTLCSAQYGDPADNTDTCISIIVGTGTNCCYLDQLSNIGKFQTGSHLPRTSDMVINTEWADYTSPELPWIDEDRVLDKASRYPGEHHFEKMTSGLYMAELVRLILVRLADEGGLFGSDIPPGLRDHESLSTPQMELAHEDESPELAVVAEVLRDAFGVSPAETPLKVRQQFKEVCRIVCRRGARLTAAATGGILFHLGRDPKANRAAVTRNRSSGALAGLSRDPSGTLPPRNVVAVEGAVLRNYKSYLADVQTAAAELMGSGAIFVEPAPKLSGTRGAALVAAASKSYMSGMSFFEP